MLLPIHIIIATCSILVTVYTLFTPSKTKLYLSYILVALTFGTGFYLVVTKPAHLTQTCTEGLIYLGVMFAGIMRIKHKLINQPEIAE